MRNLDLYLSDEDLSNKNVKLASNNKGNDWEWHSKKTASHDPNIVFGDLRDADGDLEGFWIFSMGNDKPRWMIEAENAKLTETKLETIREKVMREVDEVQLEQAKKEFARKVLPSLSRKGYLTTNRLTAQIARANGYKVNQQGKQYRIKPKGKSRRK